MIIYSYLARRFLLYCIAISTLLTFLYNFIEFFEKMLRVKHTDISTILHFLQLNTLPAFIDYLPLGAWLSTALVLKELFARHEWDILQFITFVPQRLIMFFASMGVVLVFCAFMLNEGFVATIAFKTEAYKQEKFKQNSSYILVNQWFELSQGKLFYCGICDLKSGLGSDGVLVEMNATTFMVGNITRIPSFRLNSEQQTMMIEMATMFDPETSKSYVLSKEELYVPALFSQIRMHMEPVTVFNVIRSLLLNGKSLPINAYKALLNKLCKRLEFYVQLMLYPVLSLLLFLLFIRYDYIRWIALLSAYPLMICLGLLSDFLLVNGFAAVGIFFSYLLIGGVLLVAVVKLRVLS